jgi:hypothetical protein
MLPTAKKEIMQIQPQFQNLNVKHIFWNYFQKLSVLRIKFLLGDALYYTKIQSKFKS